MSYVKDNIAIDKKPGFVYLKEYDCIYFLNSKAQINGYKNISPNLSIYFGNKLFKNIVGVLIKGVTRIVDSSIKRMKAAKDLGKVIKMEVDLEVLLNEISKRVSNKSFIPNVWYNSYGDHLEVYLTSESYCGKYINPYLTTFIFSDEYGYSNGNFCGIEIRGIKRLIGYEK